jgi:hypothetical protein
MIRLEDRQSAKSSSEAAQNRRVWLGEETRTYCPLFSSAGVYITN